VQLSRGAPRFNMRFEAGLTVAIARSRPDHQWFLLEARAHRMQKSLSDLSGTDPYIHRNSPRQVLVALTDALVRVSKQPTLAELDEIRRSYGTLFGARAFRDLVVVAVDFATRIHPPAAR
jgi:hypothetical protein